jgi:hypothetical protein
MNSIVNGVMVHDFDINGGRLKALDNYVFHRGSFRVHGVELPDDRPLPFWHRDMQGELHVEFYSKDCDTHWTTYEFSAYLPVPEDRAARRDDFFNRTYEAALAQFGDHRIARQVALEACDEAQ